MDTSAEVATLELRLDPRPLLIQKPSAFGLHMVFATPPPDAATFDLPGPRTMMLRPQLEPASAVGRLAARVVDVDWHGAPVVLVFEQGEWLKIPLSDKPLSVCPAGDGGTWVLFRERLAVVGRDGEQRVVEDVGGIRMVGTASGGVWVTNLGEARFVAADGTGSGPHPWAWPTAVARGDALLALQGRHGGVGEMLLPDGERRAVETPPDMGIFEEVLHVDDEEVLSVDGHTVRARAAGRWCQVVVQGAGLTVQGAPFVSGRVGHETHVWLSSGEHRVLPLPDDAPTAPPVRAVWVNASATMVFGGDFAGWYDGTTLQRRLVVDDQALVSEIAPVAWNLAVPQPFGSTDDGRLLVSITGPDEMAVLCTASESVPRVDVSDEDDQTAAALAPARGRVESILYGDTT